MDVPDPGIEPGSPALHAGSLPTEISGEAQEIGVGGGGHGLAWFQSLGWEDTLEKGKATHSSILAWRIPDCIVHGVAKSRTCLSDFHFHPHLNCEAAPFLPKNASHIQHNL